MCSISFLKGLEKRKRNRFEDKWNQKIYIQENERFQENSSETGERFDEKRSLIYIYLGELGEGDDGLRRRVVGTNGKIRLTIIYDDLKSELKLFVHEASGLPG